jgi:uncharacterized protein (DUF305 family)
MQNKNTIIILLVAILAVVIGYFIGSAACGNRNGNMMHQMPNGQMMMGGSMDMDDMMKSMSGSLEGKTGDAFDREFLAQMIVHHEGAVEMAEEALKNAKHQEIKDMAKAIIDAQTKEIGQMKEWHSTWYGN